MLLSVAEGMAHMHNHNPPIVHRDLKPENVLLKERPKKVQDGGKWQGVITDFGLARLKQGEVLKTKVAGTDRCGRGIDGPPPVCTRHARAHSVGAAHDAGRFV